MAVIWKKLAFLDEVVAKTATDLSATSFFKDEDNMASDDDTKVASQQSIKAYVDNNAGGLAFTELAGNDGHNVSSADTWEDWDLVTAGIIPSGCAAVTVLLLGQCMSPNVHGVRKNGSALDRKGANMLVIAEECHVWTTEVDANGVIECYSKGYTNCCKFSILGYWK